MSVEYHTSVSNMDVEETKTPYEQFFGDGTKLRYTVLSLRHNPFKIATVCLGIVCVLLLFGLIGQRIHYNKTEEAIQSTSKSLLKEKEDLRENLKVAQTEKKNLDQRQKDQKLQYDDCDRSRQQLYTNNAALTEEINQLKTSQTQSKTSASALNKELEQLKATNSQLQKDKDSLASTKNSLQTQYESVVSSKKKLQADCDSVTQDKNNLQNKFNNVTRSREELQVSYNELIQKVEHLQDKHNISTSEKDKLASSHQDLMIELETLQETCNIVKKAQNDLQASFTAAVKEKHELESRLKSITEEKDLLKVQKDNLTAEREQLLEKVDKLNTTIQEKRCTIGWRKFENSCYYTTTLKKTWSESRKFCQDKGADLAIINSEAEMNFINSLYSSDKEAWIGLTDGGIEGHWTWVDGTQLTLTFWAKGQPNSHQGRNQDCVEFWHRANSKGDWNDESCTVEQSWICET